MEYSVDKEVLNTCKVTFEGCSEEAIDLDFNLPDYCPDIQKILKCQVYPKVNARNIVGDRLNVEGVSIVNLLYLDSEKLSIRCCEHSSPFSVSFNLKEPMENAIAFTKVKVEYINCRAVTQRRLDIHGAFSICAKIKQKDEKSIVCEINGDTIEQRKTQVNLSDLVGFSQQMFTVNETVELDSALPPIELIIRSNLEVFINDYKTITNKLIINATANLDVFYISDIETGETEKANYSVPISQIVDVNGMEDECLCDITIDELNHDLQLKTDSNGEGNLLEVEARFSIACLAYKEKEINVLNDVYSTDYEMENKSERVTLPRYIDGIDTTCSMKNDVEINTAKLKEVINVWNEIIDIAANYDGDKILFKGKFNICVLVLNEDGETVYSERLVDFEYPYSWKSDYEDMNFDPQALVLSLDADIKSDKLLEISAQVKITTPVYTSSQFSSICDLSIDEEKVLNKDSAAALTIYYANAGEEMWNIARKYNTSVDLIKKENEIDEDVLSERMMILIPM